MSTTNPPRSESEELDNTPQKRAERALEWCLDEAERGAGREVDDDAREEWRKRYLPRFIKAIERKRTWEKDGPLVLARARIIGALAASNADLEADPDEKDAKPAKVSKKNALDASDELDCQGKDAAAPKNRVQRFLDRAKWC